MKKKILSVVLVVVVVFSAFGCLAPNDKETKQGDSANTEETAKTEEEDADEKEGPGDSQELNEDGITDQQLEALVDLMKERVQKEYLDVHGIDPAGFTLQGKDEWLPPQMGATIGAHYRAGVDMLELWESTKESLEVMSFEEDENPVELKDELSVLIADIFISWLEDEEMDETDYETFETTTATLYNTTPSSNMWLQFIVDNVTFH